MDKNVRVTIDLDVELWKQLKFAATEDRKHLVDIIRESLREWLTKHNKLLSNTAMQ